MNTAEARAQRQWYIVDAQGKILGRMATEIARVLRPGGRMGVSDIVAEDRLTADERAERGSYVGCIAGALSFSEFASGLRAVGLIDVSVTPTHAVADGMASAIIRATKPVDARPLVNLDMRGTREVADAGCGCGAGGCY